MLRWEIAFSTIAWASRLPTPSSAARASAGVS